MDVENFAESEVAIAVAATAAVLSPRVRGVLRRGAVYGVAGALIAGDAAASLGRGFGRGARDAGSSTGGVLWGGAGKVGGALRSAAQRTRQAARLDVGSTS